MNRSRGFGLFIVFLLAAVSTKAQQIDIRQQACSPEVTLIARNAHFSEVLRRLSQTLDFELAFAGGADPLIDVEMTQAAPELVVKLSPNDSVVVTQAPDPVCPKRSRIVKVWVLPNAGSSTGSVASTVPPVSASPPRPSPSPAQTTTHYDPKVVEEMSRKAKEMYDSYVRIHGVPPPTQEEESAK